MRVYATGSILNQILYDLFETKIVFNPPVSFFSVSTWISLFCFVGSRLLVGVFVINHLGWHHHSGIAFSYHMVADLI
jgi:hypothetical protein